MTTKDEAVELFITLVEAELSRELQFAGGDLQRVQTDFTKAKAFGGSRMYLVFGQILGKHFVKTRQHVASAAAAAVKKVSVIKNKYNQQLAQAPVAEKKRLEDEAGDAMVKAVTDQGLSVEEYTTILTAAQKDPVVHDKLVQRMK
jgi:hypothetical protein